MIMRRALMMALAGAAFAAANPPYGHAKTKSAYFAPDFAALLPTCTDNGTNTPTGVNPPQFAFAASGGAATGTLCLIDILVPDNAAAPGPFTITGALSGTASLFSSTPWTSGQLDSYLGISASPTNPIGAYLPSTQTFQPSATGFFVFTADLGSTTLLGTSGVGGTGQNAYLMQLGQGLAQGSYVVGFLEQSGAYGATANSGAIFEDGRAVPEPATWAMMLLGFGGIGMAMRRGRRNSKALMQVA